jgi:hypothetical protein
VGQACVDLHTLLEMNGQALHTKKNKREKIKGTLTVKVTFPTEVCLLHSFVHPSFVVVVVVGLSHSHFRQLFKDIETLKQLKEASKSKY